MAHDESRPGEPIIRWRGRGSEWVGTTLRLKRGPDEPRLPPTLLPTEGANTELARNLIRFAGNLPDEHIAAMCELPIDRVKEMRGEGSRTP
jgi:hypothetical protein